METYEELTQKFREENYRNLHHDKLFEKIIIDLDQISKREHWDEVIDTIAGIFRLLRNACIACRQNQEGIMKADIPKSVVDLLFRRCSNSVKSDKMRLCGLEFCGNFVADNATTRRHLWTIAYPAFFEYFICDCTGIDEGNRNKIRNVCCMVLYNCLFLEDVLDEMMGSTTGQKIVISICNQHLVADGQHWHVLCIQEHFFRNTKFLPLVFERCPPSAVVCVLEILLRVLTEERDSTPPVMTLTAIILSVQLSKLTKDGSCGTNLKLLSLIIQNLCWLTASAKPFADSSGDKLASNVISLLRDICTASKAAKQRENINGEQDTALAANGHMLKNVTQPENTANNETDSKYGHDGMIANEDVKLTNSCLQRDLVRLIGNLCFQNSVMQNNVRDLDGIPLILDSCNIDDANPFMQQWAVFAIRNLCENNPQNQAEIARLEKLGIADSPVLRDMGLTAVREEDGKIRIVKTKNVDAVFETAK